MPYPGRGLNWTSNQRHTVHVMLYCTWRPRGLATGLHWQGFFLPFTMIHSILLFNIRAWQSFSRKLSPSPLWSISWSGAFNFVSIHFFIQSLSSFCNTCPCCHNLFCCSTVIIISFIHSLYLSTLSFTLMPHIHLIILISAVWSATSFSFFTGQVSLQYNILLCTQLPLLISDISLLVSKVYLENRRQNRSGGSGGDVGTAEWIVVCCCAVTIKQAVIGCVVCY